MLAGVVCGGCFVKYAILVSSMCDSDGVEHVLRSIASVV